MIPANDVLTLTMKYLDKEITMKVNQPYGLNNQLTALVDVRAFISSLTEGDSL